MKVIKYGAVLIGIYLVVSYATGAGKLLTSGSSAAGTLVQRLQGR